MGGRGGDEREVKDPSRRCSEEAYDFRRSALTAASSTKKLSHQTAVTLAQLAKVALTVYMYSTSKDAKVLCAAEDERT